MVTERHHSNTFRYYHPSRHRPGQGDRFFEFPALAWLYKALPQGWIALGSLIADIGQHLAQFDDQRVVAGQDAL